jgi:hypothetical protein
MRAGVRSNLVMLHAVRCADEGKFCAARIAGSRRANPHSQHRFRNQRRGTDLLRRRGALTSPLPTEVLRLRWRLQLLWKTASVQIAPTVERDSIDVAQFLGTFRDYPPRQKAASFTIQQILDKMGQPRGG